LIDALVSYTKLQPFDNTPNQLGDFHRKLIYFPVVTIFW